MLKQVMGLCFFFVDVLRCLYVHAPCRRNKELYDTLLRLAAAREELVGVDTSNWEIVRPQGVPSRWTEPPKFVHKETGEEMIPGF